MFDYSKLVSDYGKVKSVHEVVHSFKINFIGNAPTMHVRIYRTGDRKYYAETSYWFGSTTPYHFSYVSHDILEDAVKEVFDRGLEFYNPGLNVEQLKIRLNKDYYSYEEIKHYDESKEFRD